MSRKRRRSKNGGSTATAGRTRPVLVPWRERSRAVLARLRAFARDGWADALERFLTARFGEAVAEASVSDLQTAFDDYVCTPGSAGDDHAPEQAVEGAPARSILRVFVDEEQDLDAEERRILPTWETERTRRVYLLDHAHRDRLALWDPLAGGRTVLHLIDKLPAAAAAALSRGTVVVATSAPWAKRRIVLGQLELYDTDDAVEMYRGEVRQGGRMWHDLPPSTPARGL